MKRKHNGSSLVLALGISLSLLILIMAVSTTLSAETKTSVNQQKKIQAYYIARSGAEATAKWITTMTPDEDTRFNNSFFPLHSNNNSLGNNTNGTFDLRITKQSEKITVISTGKIDNITDTVALVLKAQSINTSKLTVKTAIWGIDNLTIKSNVNGDVGTSSQNPVILDWGFNINGKIYTNGTVNKPDYSNAVTIHPLSESYNYASPIFQAYPNNLTNMSNILLDGGEPKNGSHYSINGNTYYDTITVTANRFLQINTNNHDTRIRIKNFDVQQGRIIINGSGKLTLFIDNLINLKGTVNKDGSINNSNQLLMYCNTNNGLLNLDNGVYINGSLYIGNSSINITGGTNINGDIVTTGKSFKMGGGSNTLSGIIYAPNADINLSSGANINGAVIGKTVTLENGGETVTLINNSITSQNEIQTSQNTTAYIQDHWK